MAVDEGQRQKRTPFSARLPQAPLGEVLPVVEALSALGAPSTPHVIAQQMGKSYNTDARFRTRLGAAGYYGFIEKQGDRRVLTPRGEAVTSGSDGAARQARREAVMSSSFGPIMHSLRGRPVNENTVALRLQSDFQVPEGSAPSVAKVLVTAATEAELVQDDKFDAAEIENLAALMPSGDALQTDSAAKRPVSEKKEGRRATSAASGDPGEKVSTGKKQLEVQERPFVPGVQVVVKIDASTLKPREIAELVRELQNTSPQE